MATVAGMRREPVQARAKMRIQRVLDAAESVFVEVGYEGASTNAIAARAGTSIGSLYEFFPNKQAVAKALADRYEEELEALYERAVINLPGGRDEIVSHIFDELGAFYEQHPGMVPLLRGSASSAELTAAGAALHTRFTDHLGRVIAQRRQGADPMRTRVVAMTTAEIIRALLDRSATMPADERAALLDEAKTAVIAYVAAAVPRTQ